MKRVFIIRDFCRYSDILEWLLPPTSNFSTHTLVLISSYERINWCWLWFPPETWSRIMNTVWDAQVRRYSLEVVYRKMLVVFATVDRDNEVDMWKQIQFCCVWIKYKLILNKFFSTWYCSPSTPTTPGSEYSFAHTQLLSFSFVYRIPDSVHNTALVGPPQWIGYWSAALTLGGRRIYLGAVITFDLRNTSRCLNTMNVYRACGIIHHISNPTSRPPSQWSQICSVCHSSSFHVQYLQLLT